MLRERVEGKWIDCFAEVFAKCGAVAGDSVAILSETQSRQINVELSELALLKLGCRPFHLIVPSPRLSAPAPVRSTGASNALPGSTDLTIELEGARVGGVWGYTSKPGTVAHWPGGLCLAFPGAGSVNGKLVLAPGDVNLTFKRYLRDVIALSVDKDYVSSIDGEGVDADMMRGYFSAWGDREAYGVSHVGWGMNPKARWDAMAFYDGRNFNGTELRTFDADLRRADTGCEIGQLRGHGRQFVRDRRANRLWHRRHGGSGYLDGLRYAKEEGICSGYCVRGSAGALSSPSSKAQEAEASEKHHVGHRFWNGQKRCPTYWPKQRIRAAPIQDIPAIWRVEKYIGIDQVKRAHA